MGLDLTFHVQNAPVPPFPQDRVEHRVVQWIWNHFDRREIVDTERITILGTIIW